MATYLTGTFTVIHNATTADFTNYIYSRVYFNVAGTYTINGASVIAAAAGDTIDVIVNSSTTTLSSSNFLLLGNPKPIGTFTTGMVSATGDTVQYVYVDIKSGNPITT
jgi:hypothetical protein